MTNQVIADSGLVALQLIGAVAVAVDDLHLLDECALARLTSTCAKREFGINNELLW